MANEVIQVGSKIEMRTLSKRAITEEEENVVYISQFLQWVDTNIAMVAVPLYKGHLVPLRTGDNYELRFYTKSGLYRCRASVLKRAKTSNNIAVAEMKFISALEKYQRRQFYRMDCIMPVSYVVTNDVIRSLYREKKHCMDIEQKLLIEKQIEEQQISWLTGTILDISGGGIRFNSEVQQNSGDVLLLLPNWSEDIKKRIPFLFGRVISSRRIANKEQIVFDNRIEFVEISHGEQEHIITYIFKEERDKRKRESDFK